MSALLPAGSRLVAVLGVIKNPGQEINYGTGGEVAAAGLMLRGTFRCQPADRSSRQAGWNS